MPTDFYPVLDVVYGGVLFVATNALLAYIGHVAGRRLLPAASMPTRLTASGLVCAASVVIIAQALSPFALYRRDAAALVVLVAALVVQRQWGSFADVRGDVESLWRSARATAASRGGIVMGLALAALAALVWRALTGRPMGWDSLTYHLPSAAAFVQAGRLVTLDGPLSIDHYAHFPKNSEILASWLLLPFHADFVVGLMNVGLLVLCGLAVCGLAREVDLEPRDAALAATAICTSPFLYSFATTQNVDGLVTWALVASSLFLIRYLLFGTGVDAFLTCLAAGLAVGTKYTSLALAGMVLGTLGVAAVYKLARAGSLARAPAWALVAVCTVGAVGARQYVLNAVETRNPLYPLTLKIGGVDVLPGSPYTDRLIEELGPGDRGDDRFQFSGMFHYYPDWKTPTAAGPKYVVLVLLSLVAALWGTGRRAWAIRLIVAFAIAGVIVAELPETGLPAISRRFWPASASRFMGAYFAFFAVAGLSMLTRWQGWRATGIRLVIVGYIAGDLMAIGYHRLEEHRGTGGWRDYASAAEVDQAPNRFVQGWQFVDQAAPLTIALATGSDVHGQNRYVFPLLGSRLQNTVTYIPINESDPPGSKGFVLRENPRYSEWLSALERRRTQLVFVQDPWPLEDAWMREHPDRFTLVMSHPHVRIYQPQP